MRKQSKQCERQSKEGERDTQHTQPRKGQSRASTCSGKDLQIKLCTRALRVSDIPTDRQTDTHTHTTNPVVRAIRML